MAGKRNRRNFLKELAGTVAGAAAVGGLVAADTPVSLPTPAPPPTAPEPGALANRTVHWVSEGRRCIVARVIEEKDGVARLEFAQRPAVSGRTFFERADFVPRHELGTDPVSGSPQTRYKPLTWHRAEGCPCGRAYSEWWYGRKSKEGPALLDEGIRKVYFNETPLAGKARFVEESVMYRTARDMDAVEDLT